MSKLPIDKDWDEFHDDEFVNWKRIRSVIQHENELTHHRITWLLSSQAFLFAAFVTTLNGISQKLPENCEVLGWIWAYKLILVGLAFIGIGVSFFLWRTLRDADIELNKLHAWWNSFIIDRTENLLDKDKPLPDNSLERHPPIGAGLIRGLSFKDPPHSIFSILFVIPWAIFAHIPVSIYKYSELIQIFSILIDIISMWMLITVAINYKQHVDNKNPDKYYKIAESKRKRGKTKEAINNYAKAAQLYKEKGDRCNYEKAKEWQGVLNKSTI
jgi:hypothetical protein